jgi:predicted lipoprotein
MKHLVFSVIISAMPIVAFAENAVTSGIVQDHILPRFERLAHTSQTLASAAKSDCSATSQPLRAAYVDAFDAWISASHLRFGPTEIDDRAFALAFWPDSRGVTPKALNKLIANQDPIAENPASYDDVSIAARGFYALDFLIYDQSLSAAGDNRYRCMLIQTITADTAVLSQAIAQEWVEDYGNVLQTPSANGTYRSDEEVLQELLKAVSTGLQFTSETRLGRPLGTYQKPRPTRAEAWRSGRSAHHVELSLLALHDLATRLAGENDDLAAALDVAFDRATHELAQLNDPIFAGVAEPQNRIKVEVIQQSVERIRVIVRDQLGPELGVAAGFNALDGD